MENRNSKKILLVDPPCQVFGGMYRFYFPGGLVSIAGNLKKQGHEVIIADLEHRTDARSQNFVENINGHDSYMKGLKSHPIWGEYEKILKDFRPDIVGMTGVSPKILSVKKLAEIAKSINPEIRTVVGGNHATVRPQDFLKYDSIDFAISGEGEESMLHLIDALPFNESTLKNIGGLSFKQGGKIMKNALAKPIKDLDSLPMPSRESLMDLDTYRSVDMGMITTSRGCQYKCTFCEVPIHWKGKVRFRSIDNVVLEMLNVKKKFDTKYFSFRDSTFTFNRDRTIDFSKRLIEEGMDINWECLTKPNYLDEELIDYMQRAGCDKIRLGVESGSPEIIKYMKKGATIDDVKNASRMLNQADMDWSSYFMLGVPRETEDTMQQTLELMQEINPRFISLTKYTPMPGSEMYYEVVNAGLLDPDKTDWAWSLNQSLERIFVRDMDPDVFRDKMTEVANYVKMYNSDYGNSDKRMKV